jgi:hypothetical protein
MLSGKCMTDAIGSRVVGDIDPERNTAGSSASPAGRTGHRSIERPGRRRVSARRSGGKQRRWSVEWNPLTMWVSVRRFPVSSPTI